MSKLYEKFSFKKEKKINNHSNDPERAPQLKRYFKKL